MVLHTCRNDCGYPDNIRSLASNPQGCGECQYDAGNIFDHAISVFVNTFTSDEPADFVLNQELDITTLKPTANANAEKVNHVFPSCECETTAYFSLQKLDVEASYRDAFDLNQEAACRRVNAMASLSDGVFDTGFLAKHYRLLLTLHKSRIKKTI
jgi:hypothetical protein